MTIKSEISEILAAGFIRFIRAKSLEGDSAEINAPSPDMTHPARRMQPSTHDTEDDND